MNEGTECRTRRGRGEAGLIKECARVHGVSDRAVRAWRDGSDPRWLTFLRNRAAAPLAQLDLPAGGEETSPAREEAAAERRFLAIQRLVDAEIMHNRIATLAPLLKSAAEAQKLLDACRESRRRSDLARGETFTRSDLRRVHDAQARVGEIMRNMPSELGPKANSFDAAFGIAACQAWLANRFEPAMKRALDEVRAIVGAEAPADE